jgi:hypothetical protein
MLLSNCHSFTVFSIFLIQINITQHKYILYILKYKIYTQFIKTNNNQIQSVNKSEQKYEMNNQEIINSDKNHDHFDLIKLSRYLHLGYEVNRNSESKTNDHDIDSNCKSLGHLIKSQRGKQVIEKIKEINKQTSDIISCKKYTISALAYCARNNDCIETKRAAYDCLSEICPLPFHLFEFLTQCEYYSGKLEDTKLLNNTRKKKNETQNDSKPE